MPMPSLRDPLLARDDNAQALQRLMDEVDQELEAVEAASGTENYELRALIEMIRV